MRTVGYTTPPPRNVFPAGKWYSNVLVTATHDGVWGLRCDRILWKSTVEPEPDHEGDESEVPHPKARTRVGKFFANFKMRYRKGSYSSCTSSELSNHGHAPSVPSRDEVSTPSHSTPDASISTHMGTKDPIVSSQFVTPKVATPEVVRSSPVDNLNGTNVDKTLDVGVLRTLPVDQAHSEGEHRGPSHTGTVPTRPAPLSTTPLLAEPVPTPTTPKDEQVVRNGPPRWRFLPFFRGDSGQTTAPTDPALTPGDSIEVTASSAAYRPSKGDVGCLGYGSLDDRAMRRLEGRSDHRPVIGSFAIYL